MKKIFMGFCIFCMLFGFAFEINGATELKAVESTYFTKEQIEDIEDIGIDLNLNVLWCANLSDNLLIYASSEVIQGIGLKNEKQYIEKFIEDIRDFYEVNNVSIFVHRKGYYIKNNIPMTLR